MSHRIVCLIAAGIVLPALLQANPTFAAARDARERAARKACMTGDPTKGVAILADLFIDTKNPTYIFNQGRCLEQNRKYEDAIARFEEYLRAADKELSGEDREAAEKHIASCRESLAQERGISPPTAAAQPVVPPPPIPTPVSTPESPPTTVVQPRAEPEPHESHGGAGLRTAGIVIASVGVAAVVGALVLNVKANNMIDDMEKTNNGYSVAKVNDQKTYKTAAWVGYGVGAACVATGAVLFGVGLKAGKGSSADVALLPAVGPGQVGALLTGGF